MSIPLYQVQDTPRVAGRGLAVNHSRAVGRGLAVNHSRAVASVGRS